MYQKTCTAFILFLLTGIGTLVRAETLSFLPVSSQINPHSIALRASRFMPDSKIVSQTHSGIKRDFGIEYNYSINPLWDFFINYSQFQKKGELRDTLNSHSKLHSRSVTLGAKRLFELTPNVAFYLGAGIGASHIRLNHENIAEKDSYHKTNPCAVFKSGFRFDIAQRGFIDIFCDYNIQHYKLKDQITDTFGKNLNMRGLNVGLGLGFKY